MLTTTKDRLVILLDKVNLPQHVAEAFQSQLQLTLNEVLANQGEPHVDLLP